jgi:hypothetical protein
MVLVHTRSTSVYECLLVVSLPLPAMYFLPANPLASHRLKVLPGGAIPAMFQLSKVIFLVSGKGVSTLS